MLNLFVVLFFVGVSQMPFVLQSKIVLIKIDLRRADVSKASTHKNVHFASQPLTILTTNRYRFSRSHCRIVLLKLSMFCGGLSEVKYVPKLQNVGRSVCLSVISVTTLQLTQNAYKFFRRLFIYYVHEIIFF